MRVFRRIHALPLAAAALTIGALAAGPAGAADTSMQQTATQQSGVSSAAQVPGNVDLNPKATAEAIEMRGGRVIITPLGAPGVRIEESP